MSSSVWGCAVCHYVKHSNHLVYGLLQLLTLLATQASRFNIGFIIKLPATAQDAYDCKIMIDNPHMKWVQWNAAWEDDSMAEAFSREFIDMWVWNTAILDDIISDRDTRIMSHFWRSLTAQLEIKLHRSTAYLPQTDGPAQNPNTVVHCYLKMYVSHYPMEWDHWVPLDEFILNAAYHMSLKTSPFQGDMGLMPRMPINPLVLTPSANWQLQIGL